MLFNNIFKNKYIILSPKLFENEENVVLHFCQLNF
jgi:hypothetical protein